MDRKRIILVLLSLGFASLIVYDTGIVTRKSGNSIEDSKNRMRVSRIKARLDRKEVSTYRDAKRDIFNPLIAKQQQPSVHATIPASMPEKMPMPPPPPPLPEAPPPPPSPTEVELFASQVKFLGFLEGSGAKTVFISKGPDVLTVRKGDTIKERFKVFSLTDREMLLRDSSTGDEAMVLLLAP